MSVDWYDALTVAFESIDREDVWNEILSEFEVDELVTALSAYVEFEEGEM